MVNNARFTPSASAMTPGMQISIGQFSDHGRKPRNDDFHGVRLPGDRLMRTKGICAAIADGVSASERGHEAAGACVSGFLADYMSTPESWSVRKSAQQVLTALNAWLYSQGHAYRDPARGLLSTLSALVLKSTTAHVFHVGDSRIYLLRAGSLEPLTTDHKTWVASGRRFLSRAMGIDPRLDIDYSRRTLEPNDTFLFTTDGVHEFITDREMARVIGENAVNLDKAAEIIARTALANGSQDNVTVQILRVESLPAQQGEEIYQQLTELPFPPPLEAGMVLDGYRIARELHASSRTQLYLAEDMNTGMQVALKTPSVNFDDDPAYIEQFIQEEWVGRRLDNPHVMRVHVPARRRQFLYTVMEYIEGRTLRQWMHDHPRPDLEAVRLLVEQIARGLQAFHRLEMTHRDLKPENVLIDARGTAKIVDFGSARVAGIAEIETPFTRANILGTRNYCAPEYLDGQAGDNRSDIYSLGVIAYEMLAGQLPGGEMPEDWRAGRRAAPRYTPIGEHRADVPHWVDGALRKAASPQPERRYGELSEFLFDLRHPNRSLVTDLKPPLIERNPVMFWKVTAVLLLLANFITLFYLLQ
jgi:serine/threonine protein phosphatase PrpC